MKALTFAALLTILPSLCRGQQPSLDQVALQGSWRGTVHGTNRAKYYVLVFCGDSLIVVNLRLGSQESIFRLNQENGAIDIEREDGLQRGVYSLEGDTLKLTLSDVNGPRPNTPEARPYNKSSYIFEREK